MLLMQAAVRRLMSRFEALRQVWDLVQRVGRVSVSVSVGVFPS